MKGFDWNKLLKRSGTVLVTVLSFTVLYTVLAPDAEDWNGIDSDDDDSLSMKLFNRFYFAATTLSTVGFGDISPKSVKARSLVLVQYTFVIVEVMAWLL